MTNLEQLNNLIRLFHEKQVVEKIALSKGDICVYNWQCNMFEKELKMLSKNNSHCECMIKENEYSTIKPQDALQISFICIMAGIDTFELLKIYEELPVALRKIKGKLSYLAENIAHFIGIYEDGDLNMEFSDYTSEELLKIFFK